MSSEKNGIDPFDFTNNEMLKESGFGIEGKTVDGYVTKDGITLNINSHKALNYVVGHEITHVLEGTDLYAQLQTALAECAKAKGEYDSRRANIEELYRNVKDADIDAELTAELVGDYLFSDPEFVRNLSVNHRNVFLRIYDEIKYLLKQATAGSDEARKLEKAKKIFDDAHRGKSKQNVDMQDQLTYNKQGLTESNGGAGYVRTDEFRRLQEESRGMSDEDIQLYRSGDKKLDEELRERLSGSVKQIFLETNDNGISNANGLLSVEAKGNQFSIYENVNGELFHDVFEISRNYLKFGELVDLHGIETTEDGIGYNDCYNYLSEDGLSGFSITPDGDLISVFNASGKNGFLRAIAPIVKSKAKTLDCYSSQKQDLKTIYQSIFGFKTASVMDYNMEDDHDNIAENHGNPQVAFMVNTEADVKEKHFSKDQYDEAVNYRNSYTNNQISSTEAPESGAFFDGENQPPNSPSGQTFPDDFAPLPGNVYGKDIALETAKKLFDDAYRKGGKNTVDGTKYATSISYSLTFAENTNNNESKQIIQLIMFGTG